MGDHPADGSGKGRQVGYGENIMSGAGKVILADDKIRAVLERVAREANKASHSWAADKANSECVLEVLERRLLPLLLAGAKMRLRLDYERALPCDIQIREQWDAALAILAAAQGQPEKESGR